MAIQWTHFETNAKNSDSKRSLLILIMILGGDATHIRYINVSPEGAGHFQESGGDGRLSTAKNRAEHVKDKRERVGSLIH